MQRQIEQYEVDHYLYSLIDRFEMHDDVRSQLTREFLKGLSFYQIVRNRITAGDRVFQQIVFCHKWKGNLVIAFYGRQRHGKSTVARFWALILHLARLAAEGKPILVDGWEKQVMYDRSYSRMTTRVMKLVQGLLQTMKPKEILELLRGMVCLFDEQTREHETDSIKAKNDLKNLIDTVASAGIHFFLVSPKKRPINCYFRIKVVGFDPATQENLSFYYSEDGYCEGYILSPRVEETEKYDRSKEEFIFALMEKGGRDPATVKFGEEPETPLEEIDIQTAVEADEGLVAITEKVFRRFCKRLTTPRTIEATVARYFQTQAGIPAGGISTWREVADITDDPRRVNTIRKESNALMFGEGEEPPKLSKTAKGRMFELALRDFLNSRLGLSLDTEIESKPDVPVETGAEPVENNSPVITEAERGEESKTDSPTDKQRSREITSVFCVSSDVGGSHPDLVFGGDNGDSLVAVNSKLYFSGRGDPDCLPECEVAAFPYRVRLLMTGKQKPILSIRRCQQVGEAQKEYKCLVGCVEGLGKWVTGVDLTLEDWIDELRRIIESEKRLREKGKGEELDR